MIKLIHGGMNMGTFDKVWDEIHEETSWGRYPSEEVIRFIARNYYKIEDRKMVKLLDFGCGAGAVAWYMAREGFDVYAFDGSNNAIKKAIEMFAEENLTASFSVQDAGSLIYQEDMFDAIVDSATIYSNKLEDISKILKEVYRILKKDGKIISTGLFNSKTTGFGTGEYLAENTYRELTEGPLAHRGTVHFFKKEEIFSIWSSIGFREIKIDENFRTEADGEIYVGSYSVIATK